MPTAMPLARFWDIIADTARPQPEACQKALRDALAALSLDDIQAFELTFRRLLNRAYTWDLWGAAFVIHGGCSDDGFEYFRRWLVVQGREVYETALADPDSLAEAKVSAGPDGMWEFEEIYYVAVEVFEKKGGDADVRNQSDPEAGMDGSDPRGQPFQEDPAHLAQRYPKLWQRFGEDPLG
jgi:hypothetical protein